MPLFIYLFYFILLYNTVLVLPYINMNPPQVYMSFPILKPPPTSLPKNFIIKKIIIIKEKRVREASLLKPRVHVGGTVS